MKGLQRIQFLILKVRDQPNAARMDKVAHNRI